ncbi:hypothetical protein AB6C62_24330 [Vibrio splendidus]|uniref:hypothetical protein n=1 Tax=Vibrio splendidus TaxID=29497 RepID=UPI000C857AAB|nr:hypothetical protein [Vibrio splendidus]PMO16116.1 hypothetical protein BCT15_24290 [Vibrio splendidus]
MSGRILYIAAFIALMTTNMAQAAFEIRAEVKAGGVRWDNVTRYNGKMLPSKWETPPMLQASEAWAAATFSAPPPISMTLIGGSGNTSPKISIDISGVQYNTTGIEFAQSANTGGGCSFDKVSLPIVTVEGTSCVSSFRLINKQKSSPFIFLRPIFDINESEIVSALSGLPEGLYSASVPLNIRYYYENDGIMTYRNINEVMLFSFDSQPVQLDSVYVSGDGVMTPTYDIIGKKITSETSFDITVNGYFNDGIVLTMPQQSYELVNSNSTGVVIPYSINCVQCNSSNLVNKGKLTNQTTAISDGVGVQTTINFKLDFDYNIEGSSAASGDYSDEVTIMLEPGI